jgi:F0F1-type ATP synthase alpha subunit
MRASEIVDVLKNEIASIDQKIEFEEVGQVVKVFDGIAIA